MTRLALRDFDAVLAVGRRGSFRQAAIDLGLSTTALSHMIARGQGAQIAAHMPRLLQELVPLLQQATPEQRWALLKQIG